MTFDDLLVSGEELDRELLTKGLKPFIRIERETLAIRPLSPWRSLTTKQKVVTFLLARKGMRAHGLVEDESCLPAELIRGTGIPAGSVHPALKSLLEVRPQIVERDARSRYRIPNWAVGEAVQMIAKGNEDDDS